MVPRTTIPSMREPNTQEVVMMGKMGRVVWSLTEMEVKMKKRMITSK